MEDTLMERLRKQVEEEIPYVVGKGQFITTKRKQRLRELCREHGIPDYTLPRHDSGRPRVK